MPNYNLTRLFALPGLKINKVSSLQRKLFIYCESNIKKPICPHCHCKKVRTHQYYTRDFKDSILRGKIQILKIKFKRYRCAECSELHKRRRGEIKKPFNEGFLKYRNLWETSINHLKLVGSPTPYANQTIMVHIYLFLLHIFSIIPRKISEFYGNSTSILISQ